MAIQESKIVEVIQYLLEATGCALAGLQRRVKLIYVEAW